MLVNTKKRSDIPDTPNTPEIEPRKDLPSPAIQPDFPDEPLPNENPVQEPMPEIDPTIIPEQN